MADPGWIEASVIGIRRCPIGFTGALQSGYSVWNGYVNSTGYRSNMFDVPDKSWAMTSIGAEDQWYLGDYVGRLLTDIIPTTGTAGTVGHGGVLAYSKDHGYVDSVGNLVVHVIAPSQRFQSVREVRRELVGHAGTSALRPPHGA